VISVAEKLQSRAHSPGEMNCRANGGNCVPDPLTPFDLAQGRPFATFSLVKWAFDGLAIPLACGALIVGAAIAITIHGWRRT